MLGKALKVVVLCVVALLFAGCTSKAAFQITPLSDEASRIMFSQNKPMGCMLVGEQEGRAYVGNTNATMDMLEESAKNDMLNKCVYMQANSSAKRMVVYFAEKKWSCKKGSVEQPCDVDGDTDKKRKRKRGNIASLVVVGEIYECNF